MSLVLHFWLVSSIKGNHGTSGFKVLIVAAASNYTSDISRSISGKIRRCRSAFVAKIIDRHIKRATMATATIFERVQLERRQRMHERKGNKAGFRVSQLDWYFGSQIHKPIRPTQSPQPQRKLSLRSNPRPLWPPQPQISLPQLQQLLRRLPRLNLQSPPLKNRRPRRKPDLRSDPDLTSQTPATVHTVSAGQ